MSKSPRPHWEVGRGAWPRFASIGNQLQAARDANRGGRVLPVYGRRFCETCQLLKPKGTRPAVKGWQCDDCRAADA